MAQGGNITTEMVTVRMNRADIKTPWGFRVSIPGLITGVEDGSLAERAGIQNGDVIEEIQGERVKDIERIKNLVNIPVNEIELVLYRNMMSTRLWRPTITDNSNYVESNAKQPIIPNPKVLVNLEHRPMNQDPLINGFNCSAKPFSATAQSKPFSGGVDASNYQMSKSLHNTFNTDKAEQYYHESGGLFGSDPNAKYGFGHKKEHPAYLNSETLKMIQEDDQNKETLKSVVFARDKSATPNRTSIPTQSRGPLNPNLPICFHCGRNILGLVCRASEVNLHADCFSCSTCGSSLKNVGHQFINTKFYCDIHARQVRGISQPNTKGRMTPDLMNKPSPTNMYNKSLDTVHASYHPDIMGRHPMTQTDNLGSGKRLESNYSNKSVTRSNEERKVISPYGNNANYNQQSQARNLNNTTFDSHDYGKQQHLVNKVTKTTTTTTNGYPSGNQSNNAYENRVPYCGQCKSEIRGAFVMTGGLTYCPEHFICANASCSRKLVDVGFVEEKGKRFCEGCFEKLIAPVCNKCAKPVTGDCLNALQKQWHPTCFACAHCLKPFGNTAFYMENGKPYCEVDWNNLFTTKCVSCKFPIEAGDRWVEALGASFHSNCFSCMACHVNLEGQSFYAKNGQPYCKLHA